MTPDVARARGASTSSGRQVAPACAVASAAIGATGVAFLVSGGAIIRPTDPSAP